MTQLSKLIAHRLLFMNETIESETPTSPTTAGRSRGSGSGRAGGELAMPRLLVGVRFLADVCRRRDPPKKSRTTNIYSLLRNYFYFCSYKAQNIKNIMFIMVLRGGV